jgi:hypothetical protein
LVLAAQAIKIRSAVGIGAVAFSGSSSQNLRRRSLARIGLPCRHIYSFLTALISEKEAISACTVIPLIESLEGVGFVTYIGGGPAKSPSPIRTM